MIKHAVTEDYKEVMSYLNREGSLNTTQLSHIEKYGLARDFQEVWLQRDAEGDPILAVIVRHFNSLYLYNDNYIFEPDELGSFTSFLRPDIIFGKRDLLGDLALYLEGMVLEPSCHMILEKRKCLIPCNEVERAGLEDCEELASLIYSIPEFARFYHSPQEIERGIRRRIEMGICRYFVLKIDGRIVSQAYTTIESAHYATIGGVVTLPEYRKRGLASLVVSCISQNLLQDHKTPNLFYSNEEAGRVYENLGFVHAGDYAMLLSHEYAQKDGRQISTQCGSKFPNK